MERERERERGREREREAPAVVQRVVAGEVGKRPPPAPRSASRALAHLQRFGCRVQAVGLGV